MTTTTTKSAAARARARESRLRAVYHAPKNNEQGWYAVHNLVKHVHYSVWYNENTRAWECTCKTNNLHARCKHVQRVLDREEQRIRREALAHG